MIGRPTVPVDQMDRNIEYARSLGLPSIQGRARTCSGPLHVIGGGPSALRFVETRPKGDVWAINGTCTWLRGEGFDPVFFSCDALPMVAEFARGARRALIAEQCDPSVYDVLLKGGADITTFECNHGEVVMSGSTTATATPVTAITLGYAPVTFWGCEGNYELDRTHADRHEPRAEELIVEVGSQQFRTAPDFLKQCEELARFFALEREHNPNGPPVFLEESGGLLRAMIEHGDDHRVVWLSNKMIETIVKRPAEAA